MFTPGPHPEIQERERPTRDGPGVRDSLCDLCFNKWITSNAAPTSPTFPTQPGFSTHQRLSHWQVVGNTM